MAAEPEREISSLHDALSLLDEWLAAYEELRLEHMRLMHEYIKTRGDLKHAMNAIDQDLWIEARITDLRAETEMVE